jgi:hypothetical protein
VVGVHPVPDDVDALRVRDQLREHAPDECRILGLLVGFVAVNHELEAPDSVGDRDRHIRPRGIRSNLAIGMAERILGAIDHEPPRRGRGAVERDTHQPAGGTAAAVAADDIGGVHGLMPVGELDRHTVIGFRAVFHPPVPRHLDVAESVNPDQQFGVHHRLDESVALGPTETRIGWRHFGK